MESLVLSTEAKVEVHEKLAFKIRTIKPVKWPHDFGTPVITVPPPVVFPTLE
jgi:hypothetical protein